MRPNIMMKWQAKSFDYSLVFLVALILIMPAAADDIAPGAFGGDIMTLSGSPANYISITASDIADWVLNRGTNEENPGELRVSADGDWKITASDLSSTTNGYLTEWDGNQYIINSPLKLANPMSISVPTPQSYVDAGYEVTLPTGGKIAEGPTTNSQPEKVDVTFKQPVSLSDQVLTSGHSYHIEITFTISPYS
jgi:hypothetical protein